MPKTIRFSLLNADSIKRAIKELKAYKKDFVRKCNEFAQKVAEIGRDEADRRFTLAVYDGQKDISIDVVEGKTGFLVEAKGDAVAFIEFGAGVHYNGSGSYPLPKPEGVVPIGQYGYKLGRFDSWSFQENNVIITTHGNPAYMPMYFASVEMQSKLTDIAREVFG